MDHVNPLKSTQKEINERLGLHLDNYFRLSYNSE